MAESPLYPMYVLGCDYCGFVCTILERPGTSDRFSESSDSEEDPSDLRTGCSYINNCPDCGRRKKHTTLEKVTDSDEHEYYRERMNDVENRPLHPA